MGNRDTRVARDYHSATKHSLQSLLASRHTLDWANHPRLYKLYQGLEGLPLPAGLPSTGCPTFTALCSQEALPEGERVPDIGALASVLHFSAGITKWLRVFGGRMAFRAAACTGALYHIELYLVCTDLPGLEAGVYHFGVHDGALRRLRAGDYRGVLVEATGGEEGVAEAPVTLVSTSAYRRNAWKYGARSYRHCFWDGGTVLANTLAMARAHRLPARVVAGFVDRMVNDLIDVDGEGEFALFLVPLGRSPSRRAGPAPGAPRMGLATVPYARREADFPLVQEVHRASALTDPEEVRGWRGPSRFPPPPAPAGDLVPLRPLPPDRLPREPVEEVIRRRGSSRRFRHDPIPWEALSTILACTTRLLPADFLEPPSRPLTDLYLLVNAVEGLESGAYFFHREAGALEPLRKGYFREEAGYLALTQPLGADAAVCIYFLADLEAVLGRFGNRGYRAAHLEASTAAGRMYLAAYALGLGATGLTFFDDDVTGFFSPHARGKGVMFLIALGVPARR